MTSNGRSPALARSRSGQLQSVDAPIAPPQSGYSLSWRRVTKIDEHLLSNSNEIGSKASGGLTFCRATHEPMRPLQALDPR